MRLTLALAALALVAVGAFAGLRAAETPAAPATQPACCGAACKPMPGCCKTDDAGKTTCTMGGKCCTKVEPK